eukprot:CAMPEP_0170576298 /NCGR_PEP_ID=MMETSP0224-20130122/4318_1 /TAXON_ID=285029 /ORGANISM="Togula jolla, Strain CCCM 725" /LENGTH=206 /DNA_ID=CAMNT_0010899131 /DNA_START=191 /DNA_END=808 /DNA_ORIENTATION=+
MDAFILFAQQHAGLMTKRKDVASGVGEDSGQVHGAPEVHTTDEAHPLYVALEALPHQHRPRRQVALHLVDGPCQAQCLTAVKVPFSEACERREVAHHWPHRLDQSVHHGFPPAIDQSHRARLAIAGFMRGAHSYALDVQREDVLWRVVGTLYRELAAIVDLRRSERGFPLPWVLARRRTRQRRKRCASGQGQSRRQRPKRPAAAAA